MLSWRSTTHRVAAHWRFKLALQAALPAFFCAGYFALQRFPVFPAREFEQGALDRLVAFDPRWVWVYQSAYLLMGAVPWLADSVEALKRYAASFIVVSCGGFACFLLWPVAGPRPLDAPAVGAYGWLVQYDAPTNAFPSLHVGLTTLTILLAARMSRAVRPAKRAALVGLAVAWAAAVGFSTVATKQHYAVDVPAGALLAWMAHRWAWSRRPSVRERRIDHAEAA